MLCRHKVPTGQRGLKLQFVTRMSKSDSEKSDLKKERDETAEKKSNWKINIFLNKILNSKIPKVNQTHICVGKNLFFLTFLTFVVLKPFSSFQFQILTFPSQCCLWNSQNICPPSGSTVICIKTFCLSKAQKSFDLLWQPLTGATERGGCNKSKRVAFTCTQVY